MIGEKLFIARKKKGWTQQKLAERTGIAQTMIARYENGTIPSSKNLEKLSKHLDVSIESLYDSNPKIDSSEVFNDIEFEKRIKKLRGLPVKKKKVIYDMLAIILDLQSVQDVTAGASS